MACDICGRLTDASEETAIHADLIKHAAAVGFDPATDERIPRSPDVSSSQAWAERVESKDSTWMVCNACLKPISEFVMRSQGGTGSGRTRLPERGDREGASWKEVASEVENLFTVQPWVFVGLALGLAVLLGAVAEAGLDILGFESSKRWSLIMAGLFFVSMVGWAGIRRYLGWELHKRASLSALTGRQQSVSDVRATVLGPVLGILLVIGIIADLIWLLSTFPSSALGIAAGIACTVGLVAGVISNLLDRSGSQTDPTHEWQLVGRPGATVRTANREEVHDHYHRRGSWEKRISRQISALRILAALGSPMVAMLIVHQYLHPIPTPLAGLALGFALAVVSVASFTVSAAR